jgi:hypothetical protein
MENKEEKVYVCNNDDNFDEDFDEDESFFLTDKGYNAYSLFLLFMFLKEYLKHSYKNV